MSLNTFGAILTFAIELESAVQNFYEQASQLPGAQSERFEEYARRSAKRKQRLTAIRQDNITEMVLEPITGLDAAHYMVDFSLPPTPENALAEAVRLEGRAERFYSEAGPKLNVTEPRRAFQKLAQENRERLDELETS